MVRLLILGCLLASLAACGGDGGGPSPSADGNLATTLSTNDTWPYEAEGVLDIVEAGFDGTSDAPQWAVGMLLEGGDEFGVLVEIDGGVIARAGVNIDSGEPVRVWLESPTDVSGEPMYPVSKMEKQ
ncbi:MAG: hypothetical protein QNJ05_03040 [Woeseiaceae bacterium]|nr:hypothetical protein [Woeseiaceae bacterium]